MSLLPENLSLLLSLSLSLPLRNSHSAQVQVSSSHFENHTDSTSILIYLASTKMNKWALGTCPSESHSIIKQ